MRAKKKRCIICEKELKFKNCRHSNKKEMERRITCGKECSRIYGRVYRYVYKKLTEK